MHYNLCLILSRHNLYFYGFSHLFVVSSTWLQGPQKPQILFIMFSKFVISLMILYSSFALVSCQISTVKMNINVPGFPVTDGFFFCSADNIPVSCTVAENSVQFTNVPNYSRPEDPLALRVVYREGTTSCGAIGTIALSIVWEWNPYSNQLYFTNANTPWGGNFGTSGCQCEATSSTQFYCCSQQSQSNSVTISY